MSPRQPTSGSFQSLREHWGLPHRPPPRAAGESACGFTRTVRPGRGRVWLPEKPPRPLGLPSLSETVPPWKGHKEVPPSQGLTRGRQPSTWLRPPGASTIPLGLSPSVAPDPTGSCARTSHVRPEQCKGRQDDAQHSSCAETPLSLLQKENSVSTRPNRHFRRRGVTPGVNI